MFRKYLITVGILFLFIGAVTEGKQVVDDSFKFPVFQTPDLKVVGIPFSDTSQLRTLIDQGLTIVDVKDSRVIAHVSSSELVLLYELGYNPQILSEDELEMIGWKDDSEILRQFHTYSTMTAELQDIAANYPYIASLYDLGQSVQGRSIWGLKITDNPEIEENEPEVRICGAHHGNEYMSVELPLLMAWHLVENYGSDPYVTDLVDNRETWIIPMVNPDGREDHSRYNANGVDLNRDYGYMWQGSGGSSSPFSQPETQTIRANALDNNFVLSLSYHTTAAYVNYVWNYKPQPTPDEPLIIQLSELYASYSGYTPINGYDWYQVFGDTNDFSYGCRGDIDWTIETANSNIPYTWDRNRDAMLAIIDAADMGLYGVVTDVNTGMPIEATIWIEEVYWPCFTDPYVGDYHKPLLAGTYMVHYQANGYLEQAHMVEITDPEVPIVLDVALQPGGGFYAYQVTSCTFEGPSNYANNPTDGIHALGAPDGYCASLGVGGVVVLDMGEDIIDREDAPDFKIFEGDGSPDGYHVRASQEWDGPWTSLGSDFGTAEFDLADGDMESARYIEIQDDGDGSPYETNPGVDIDAVENLVAPNSPPEKPATPVGPTPIFAGYEHEYCTSTNDPENHQVFYKWDWGDEISGWLGPYNSGELACASHAWDNPGGYSVKVKAKDDPNGDDDPSDGLESGWSDPLYVTVSIPGDLDHDGDVDHSDLGILLADWGCTGGGCVGDIDGDGDTDQSDLGILLSNWGYGT